MLKNKNLKCKSTGKIIHPSKKNTFILKHKCNRTLRRKDENPNVLELRHNMEIISRKSAMHLRVTLNT